MSDDLSGDMLAPSWPNLVPKTNIRLITNQVSPMLLFDKNILIVLEVPCSKSSGAIFTKSLGLISGLS